MNGRKKPLGVQLKEAQAEIELLQTAVKGWSQKLAASEDSAHNLKMKIEEQNRELKLGAEALGQEERENAHLEGRLEEMRSTGSVLREMLEALMNRLADAATGRGQ